MNPVYQVCKNQVDNFYCLYFQTNKNLSLPVSPWKVKGYDLHVLPTITKAPEGKPRCLMHMCEWKIDGCHENYRICLIIIEKNLQIPRDWMLTSGTTNKCPFIIEDLRAYSIVWVHLLYSTIFFFLKKDFSFTLLAVFKEKHHFIRKWALLRDLDIHALLSDDFEQVESDELNLNVFSSLVFWDPVLRSH